MPRKSPQIGERRDRLVVLALDHQDVKPGRTLNYYRCVCDCGNEVVVASGDLRGHTKSCGCWKRDVTRITKFKGGAASYSAIHRWKEKATPKRGRCVHCGKMGKTQWANISREYNRLDDDDWLELCPRCHKRFDCPPKTHCNYGHLMDEENTYLHPAGYRRCRTCHREMQRCSK